MKKLLYVLIALVGLVLIVPSFIDWSHFKAPLIEAVKTNTGYDLDVRGSVKLGLLPTPHLKANNIVVRNRPDGKAESLLELKSVSLSLSILPLLKGSIAVDKIKLIEPNIHLETSESGQNNWEIHEKIQLSPSKSTPQTTTAKAEPKVAAEGPDISLKKVIITDGTVTINNLQTKAKHEIQNINLEGRLSSLSGPFSIRLQADMDGLIVKADVQTGKLFQNKPATINANVCLSKDKENYGTLQVAGSVEDKHFVGDITSDALKLPFSVDLANKKIDLQKGLTLKAHLDAQPEDIKVSELKAELGGIKLEGDASYKSSNITGHLLLSEGPSQITLAVQGQSNEKSLWNGKVSINSDKPQTFLKWVGADEKAPYLQGGIDLSTTLNVQDSNYAFQNLKFKVGHLDGAGDVTVKLGAAHPYIKGELSMGKVDLNALMPAEKTENTAPSAAGDKMPALPVAAPSPRWSKDKWNLDVLTAVDTDFKVNIKELCYDEYRLQQVTATLHLKDGSLQITSFGAQGYGGSFNGDISLQKDAALKLNFGIQRLDVASLPKIRKTPLKKASLTTNLHLNAKGNSMYDAVSSLAGDMSFNLSQGVVEAFDVKRFVNDIKHVKGPDDVSVVVKDLNSTAQTSFDHLKANFTVQNGKAASQDIELVSPDINLTGKGTVDLPQWLIDMKTQIKVKELTKLPALGLVIEGSLDSPSYKVDQAQLAKILLQEVANRVIDKAKEQIGGKVGQVLEGVLGGKKQEAQQKSYEPQQQKKEEAPIKPEKLIKDLLKAF